MTQFKLCVMHLVTLALLVSAPRAAHAAESYDNCTGFITSVPAVINTQGTWCMKSDLTTAITSGNAITINTNNVTLDCNDFKLGGLAAGTGTQTKGIYALNRLNATVRHCSIRGFYYGLSLEGSSGGGHAIEDNRFDGNTFTAINVEGDGSVVRRNRVFDTGGSTVITSAVGVIAIYSVDIVDNTVSGVQATTGGNNNAVGFDTNLNNNGSVAGNRVRGLFKDGSGQALGIFNSNSGYVNVHNNDLVGDGNAGSIGVRCTTSNGSAKDNAIDAFASAITNCYDAGNLVRP